ncbi:glycosyltransferase family protein [Luteimonas cucumeris]|nr:glycosyltransferase [Luteimonas cucumeris]
MGEILVQTLRFPLQAYKAPRRIYELWRGRSMDRASLSDGPTPVVRSDSFDTRIENAKLMDLPPGAPLPGKIRDLKVAAILDPFSEASFSPECDLQMLLPATWEEQIRAFRPHLLLIESAWLGRDGTWRGMIAGRAPTLSALVASCRKAGIATVFWNKEDPLHFEAFIETARLFDWVFTTDADSVTRYRRELGHSRVQLLPFALQPRAYSPVCRAERENKAFFAGAWYDRMPERSGDFASLAGVFDLIAGVDIYDRNYDNQEGRGGFPARYQGMVRGSVPYRDTPDLYRRYRFGLNLNTVKDSPTMFARRVFELIGSGTSVYGNYSRGQKNMLGELAVASDDVENVFHRAYAEHETPDALLVRSRRSLALRKVLEQHTYRHRLKHIVRCALTGDMDDGDGSVVGIASADNETCLASVLRAYERQTARGISLYLRLPHNLHSALPSGVSVLNDEALQKRPEETFGSAWIAAFHPDDYYGASYLQDLKLGRLYCSGEAIGKGAFLAVDGRGVRMTDGDQEFRKVTSLALRRSILRAEAWHGSLASLLDSVSDGALHAPDMDSLDSFSYIENGNEAGIEAEAAQLLDAGVDIEDMYRFAAELPDLPAWPVTGNEWIDGAELSSLFVDVPPGISVAARRHRLELCSTAANGMGGECLSVPFPRSRLERDGALVVQLDAPADRGWRCEIQALGARGDSLVSFELPAGVTTRIEPPEEACAYRLKLKVRGELVRHIDGLWLKSQPAQPVFLPGNGRLLLVSNIYPEGDRFYRNAFVHRRVLEYRRRGIPVDVIRVAAGEQQRSYEFEGVPVMVCSPEALQATLAISKHDAIAVHFLDESIWRSIKDVAGRTPTVVWVHGAEIQPWTRRPFNYTTDEEKADARNSSERRMSFWRKLLSDPPASLRLVFVSRTFAEECWTDLGMRLADDRWSVIHNPVDTALFRFEERSVDLRWNILSVRSHESRGYANDLTAEAVRLLSAHPLFPRMRFRLIGDGKLFDSNFADLRTYSNVRLERRQLSQAEMAEIFRENGIFLTPTRSDTQGVTRDEAMSTGLVPVTNAVSAVPEFVDHECGILVAPEDAAALAAAILKLVENEAQFLSMSKAASDRVRKQRGLERIIDQELALLSPHSVQDASALPIRRK